MLQTSIHYGAHFLIPLAVALIWYRDKWLMVWFIMLIGMLIDIDHLMANPIFDSNRCSINFHPLHSYYAIVVYLFLTLLKQTRLLGLGLIIHIIADTLDCWMMH